MKEMAAECDLWGGGAGGEGDTAGERGRDRDGDFAKRSRLLLPVERALLRFSAGSVPTHSQIRIIRKALVSLIERKPENRGS